MRAKQKENQRFRVVDSNANQSIQLNRIADSDLKRSANETPPISKRTCTRSDLRVLVVEDNEINQRLAQIMLRKIGIQSTIACDGQVAIEMTIRQVYDVIFMDIKMPNVDGVSATQAILKDQNHVKPVIIAMTANIFDQDILRYHKVGMLDVVPKPFKIDDFSASLDKFFILDEHPKK